MKKFFLLSIAIIFALHTKAAKAISTPLTFTQGDGSTITVLLHGDEHVSWYTTTDGVLLLRNQSNFYIADVDKAGELVSTGFLAHDRELRSDAERQLISKQDRQLFFDRVNEDWQGAIRKKVGINPSMRPSYFPHTGSPKAVVILAQYQDVKFTVTDPKKTFEQYLNGDVQEEYGHSESRNYGSVKQYFKDMSFGTFTPQFDIYGPVTVSKEMAYYGGDKTTSQRDTCYTELIKEACSLANSEINFADYDANNDGYVDLVYIIYAGYGQSLGAPSETIWPKSGATVIGTFDGKTVCRFGLNNELNMRPSYYEASGTTPQVNGIGLFCHEFSHTMGLPDVYPTMSSAYVDNQEMEYWDLMDAGEYTNDGYTPASYTAWEREVMGWTTIEELQTSAEGIEVRPVNDGGKAFKMVNTSNTKDYLVMENIQQKGWNSAAYGHGLLVYHVNFNNTYVSLSTMPNNVSGKPGMAVVPADGLVMSSYLIGTKTGYTAAAYRSSHAGDPFPGSTSVTRLDDTLGLPNFCYYANGASTSDLTRKEVNKALSNIQEDTATGLVTFDYTHDVATGISSLPHDRDAADGGYVYRLDGRRVPYAADTLPKGIYVKDGKKVVIK